MINRKTNFSLLRFPLNSKTFFQFSIIDSKDKTIGKNREIDWKQNNRQKFCRKNFKEMDYKKKEIHFCLQLNVIFEDSFHSICFVCRREEKSISNSSTKFCIILLATQEKCESKIKWKHKTIFNENPNPYLIRSQKSGF